jgi:hypothetical protein
MSKCKGESSSAAPPAPRPATSIPSFPAGCLYSDSAVSSLGPVDRREGEGAAFKSRSVLVSSDKEQEVDGALKTGAGDGDKAVGDSSGARISYRDAVVRLCTFRPRFPPESSHQRWFQQDS